MRREEAEELGTLETMRKLDGVQLQPLGVVEASSFLATSCFINGCNLYKLGYEV